MTNYDVNLSDEKNSVIKSKLVLMLTMCIFGTIGIFRRYIPVESSTLAMLRGLIGTFTLIVIMKLKKNTVDFKKVGKAAIYLCLSGAFIGINWILLFESYNYTTVAIATLCYYMEPTFVIIASVLLLKERISRTKIICVAVSLLGMVLVSGIFDSNGVGNVIGIVYGLGAACFYAAVVLINQKLKGIPAMTKTVFQLTCATITILPYVLINERLDASRLGIKAIVMILIVGLVHTGLAYSLYFSSMSDLSAQTVALYSYIDPVLAIILSAIVLGENMSLYQIIGTICILVATGVSELNTSTD